MIKQLYRGTANEPFPFKLSLGGEMCGKKTSEKS